MPKPEIEFTPSLAFPEQVSSSSSSRVLALDPETGDKTEVLSYPPGAQWGEPVCKHNYWVEVYILDGRVFDKTLDCWFMAGDYCCRPPGMLHGPYQADEHRGCRMLTWLRYPSEAVWTPPKQHSGFSSVSRTSFNLSRNARPQNETSNQGVYAVFEHRALPNTYTVYGAQ